MKKSCWSLRGMLCLTIFVSQLIAGLPLADAKNGDGRSRRVTTGKLLPPGVPVPGGPVPVPVPVVVHRDHGSPVVVVKHRGRKHRDKWSYTHRPYHGRVYRTLPTGFLTLTLGGGTFFYHYGTYYRHSHDGYVVVEPPIGARVRMLPDDCSDFYADGIRYYECGDVYYESVEGEYVVIEGPPRGYRWEAEIGEEVWIRADTLNIRSGPGTRYQVIGQLYRGDVVEVSDKDGNWYSVRLDDGSYGWILQEYARLYRPRP